MKRTYLWLALGCLLTVTHQTVCKNYFDVLGIDPESYSKKSADVQKSLLQYRYEKTIPQWRPADVPSYFQNYFTLVTEKIKLAKTFLETQSQPKVNAYTNYLIQLKKFENIQKQIFDAYAEHRGNVATRNTVISDILKVINDVDGDPYLDQGLKDDFKTNFNALLTTIKVIPTSQSTGFTKRDDTYIKFAVDRIGDLLNKFNAADSSSLQYLDEIRDKYLYFFAALTPDENNLEQARLFENLKQLYLMNELLSIKTLKQNMGSSKRAQDFINLRLVSLIMFVDENWNKGIFAAYVTPNLKNVIADLKAELSSQDLLNPQLFLNKIDAAIKKEDAVTSSGQVGFLYEYAILLLQDYKYLYGDAVWDKELLVYVKRANRVKPQETSTTPAPAKKTRWASLSLGGQPQASAPVKPRYTVGGVTVLHLQPTLNAATKFLASVPDYRKNEPQFNAVLNEYENLLTEIIMFLVESAPVKTPDESSKDFDPVLNAYEKYLTKIIETVLINFSHDFQPNSQLQAAFAAYGKFLKQTLDYFMPGIPEAVKATPQFKADLDKYNNLLAEVNRITGAVQPQPTQTQPLVVPISPAPQKNDLQRRLDELATALTTLSSQI